MTAPSLETGQSLGPYRIISFLAAGGMGAVYRAHDPRTGRDVAIKVAAQQFSEQFTREVRAVAALNHPNICTLYDVGPDYLVMELVEGPTLADRIAAGPVSLDEAMPIAQQIAQALEEAHEKQIVHRDLKPGNVKITPSGLAKVLDFGLAQVSEPAGVSLSHSPTVAINQTEAGMLLGTAAYMAPEQARGRPVDKRADIWAFGVVFYEMLTGESLFASETVSDTIAAVLTKVLDFPSSVGKARTKMRASPFRTDYVVRSIARRHVPVPCCAAASSAIRRSGCATSAMRCRSSRANWLRRNTASVGRAGCGPA